MPSKIKSVPQRCALLRRTVAGVTRRCAQLMSHPQNPCLPRPPTLLQRTQLCSTVVAVAATLTAYAQIASSSSVRDVPLIAPSVMRFHSVTAHMILVCSSRTQMRWNSGTGQRRRAGCRVRVKSSRRGASAGLFSRMASCSASWTTKSLRHPSPAASLICPRCAAGLPLPPLV